MPSIKLVHFAIDYPPAVGGGETYVFNTSEYFRKKPGYETYVVAGTTDPDQEVFPEINNERVIRINGLPAFRDGQASFGEFFPKLAKVFHKIKPHIIHVHSIMPGLLALIVNEITRAKLVFSNHNTPNQSGVLKNLSLNGGNPFESFVLSSNRFDAIVSISKYFSAHMLSFGVDPERLYTIYPGVNLHLFDPKRHSKSILRKAWSINEGDFVICCPVRLVPRKRVSDLLHAINNCRNKKIKVIVTGLSQQNRTQSHRETVQLIETLLLGQQIIFPAYAIEQAQMPEIFALSDLTILPSESEGLGITLIESMSMNTLVAASDIPGVREVIQDEVTGILFPPGDIDAITRVILRVFDRRTEFDHIVKAARLSVEQNFNECTQCEKLDNLYQRILS
jgi:glycosyltransferase involved in cell wall biosynthesis